ETAPTANAGSEPVRANYPARADSLPPRQYCLWFDSRDWGVPKQPDTTFLRAGQQFFMQQRPRQPEPMTRGEIRRNAGVLLDEANTFESKAFTRTKLYSQRTQRRLRFRHHAFAAGLVDGRSGAVGHYSAHSLSARGNRRRQTCRATADHE